MALSPEARGAVAGAAGNAVVAAVARTRTAGGRRGLRAATRATGQGAFVPYAVAFAGSPRRRGPALAAYTGAHVVHVGLLARLLARYGHPAAGTPKRHTSVYGGLAGYAALAALLGGASGRRRSVAEWYLFAVVHGPLIPDAVVSKDGPPALYAPLGALWALAATRRLQAARLPGQTGAR